MKDLENRLDKVNDKLEKEKDNVQRLKELLDEEKQNGRRAQDQLDVEKRNVSNEMLFSLCSSARYTNLKEIPHGRGSSSIMKGSWDVLPAGVYFFGLLV